MTKIFDDPDYWFSGTAKKTSKSKSSSGVVSITSNRSSFNQKKTATNIVKGVNRKLPQVVVKISGASKGVNRAQAHIDYIGRNGKVELEDQDGNKYNNKNEQKSLMGAWQAQGMHDKHETGTRKEAFHFVFSMPNGTNAEAMKQAVRNLVKEEFDGHQYFLAQHLDTDSPHVHVLVNATNDRGERLNPRKQDLHNYRVSFVQKLAEQGIEATATRRVHQFKYQENYQQGRLHGNSRVGQGKPSPKKPTSEQMRSIKKTHDTLAKHYADYAKSLPNDQQELKKELDKLVKSRAVGKDKGR